MELRVGFESPLKLVSIFRLNTKTRTGFGAGFFREYQKPF